MADFQPHVPQHVEHIFDDLLTPWGLLVGQQEQEIDIGTRRQSVASITADRDDGHVFRLGRIDHRIDLGGGKFEQHLDQRVHEIGEATRAERAAAVLHQQAFRIGAAAHQRIFQRLQHHLAHRKARVTFVGRIRQLVELATERIGIDDLFQLQVVCAHAACRSGFSGKELR